jgi:hypothetical protein
MASIIKADNIQKVSDGTNIIKKCGSTITLGSCGATISLACGATQTGFGRTGTVDWCTTAKTAPFTGVSGNGYFVNTACGAVTVTLPATPSAGDIISIADYTNTWQTNSVTICRNSSKIGGICANTSLSTQGQSITLVYVDATEGWKNVQDSTSNVTGTTYITATGGTEVTCGDYKIHTFTSDATFCVSALSTNPSYNNVDYVVVAGGGGGGGGQGGGGGGGGYRTNYPSGCAGIPVSIQGYPITIGGGGATGIFPGAPSVGSNGSNSVFSTITSAGGGGGGGYGSPTGYAGLPGGSGGGGGSKDTGGTSGGSGNTPPTSPPQGNNGNPMGGPGSGIPAGLNQYGGGGGGATGTPAPNVVAGGIGATTAIFGCAPQAPTYGTPGPAPGRYFAGGGAGRGTVAPIGGGAGGGGPGGTAGTTNTGGGGGGGEPCCGAGGSGIVIIRYKYQ